MTANTATRSGGGLITFGGERYMANSIFTGNAAPSGADIQAQYLDAFTPTEADSRNIVSGQLYTGTTAQGPVAAEDIFARTVVLTGGVVGGGTDTSGDGPTTVALKAELDNPALDAGQSNTVPFDIRFQARAVDIPGVPNSPDVRDLGAFEVQDVGTADEDIIILAGVSNDTINAAGGDDLVDLGEGDDNGDGGDGMDTLSFASLEAPGININGISFGVIVDLAQPGRGAGHRPG